MDSFFASIELVRHREWEGLPIIVGGMSERSVVSTANYKARQSGIHSAMSMKQARKLCPEGIFVPVDIDYYAKVSSVIMKILREFSPDVYQRSIDEAFLDITGTDRLFGSPLEIVQKIKAQVKSATGLTLSAGLATNPYIAKIASDVNKPDGLYSVEEGDEARFMLSIPLEKVWGVGKKTLAALNDAAIFSTKDIAEKSLDYLTLLFGQSMGRFLFESVRGRNEDFLATPQSHSISSEKTFEADLTDIYECETQLMALCHAVIFRLLDEGLASNSVAVKIKYADFASTSVNETSTWVFDLNDLYKRVCRLFEKRVLITKGVRLLGVSLQNTVASSAIREVPKLFETDEEVLQNKKERATRAVALLNKKYDETTLKKARLL